MYTVLQSVYNHKHVYIYIYHLNILFAKYIEEPR